MSSRSMQTANGPLTAPGPSPWYLAAPSAAPTTAAGGWTWARREEPESGGFSTLLTPDGEPVLRIDSHCYVCPLPDDRLLAWHVSDGHASDTAAAPHVTFVVLELNALVSLRGIGVVGRDVDAFRRWLWFDGGSPVSFSFRTDVGEGTHTLAPPVEFRALPELLVLADYGSERSNGFDRMYRAIFAFDFSAGCVSVLPQRWFNEGKYDFSYEWITRVQREPATGRIVGEGIRLGNFRLDASGTQVEAWLDESFQPLEKET